MLQTNPFALNPQDQEYDDDRSRIHVFGGGIVCDTEDRGYATPANQSPHEIVVDASEGFIPLWANGTTLRWRFQERSFRRFANADAAKRAIRELMGDALLAWGESAPVRFDEVDSGWDFEVVLRNADDCDINGCVLASAFFPDAGRHELVIYPRMLTQSHKEQVDTLIHEFGHVFGLRHFFAQVRESAWPSEVFGVHRPFSIMNYGAQSELTTDDTADLRRLYQLVWTGQLSAINGTPVRLVRPFSVSGGSPDELLAAGRLVWR